MNHLIALYKKKLNLQTSTFSRIDHDAGTVADVYKVTKRNDPPLILKICTRQGDYLREVYFLKKFANQLPVPQVIQTVQPEADIPGAILMEHLPGNLLTNEAFTDSLTYELGSFLAQIHLNRTKGYGDLTQVESLSSNPRHHFTLKFEEGLLECQSHLPNQLIDQSHRYYHAHVDLLDAVDGPCIIHRDFGSRNTIVDNGKVNGIIDWSSARASFAEDDLCTLEHGEWANHSKSKTSFLKGYAAIRPIPHYTTIMPLLRLSRAIATIGFTVKRDTWGTKNKRPYQLNRSFLETFLSTAKP